MEQWLDELTVVGFWTVWVITVLFTILLTFFTQEKLFPPKHGWHMSGRDVLSGKVYCDLCKSEKKKD